MTIYDPTRDPRYIPFTPAPLREDPVELGNTLVQLETADESWQRLMSMFEHPGWAEFAAILAKDHDEIDRKIKSTTDHYEWAMLRGQLLWSEWVLSLPEEAAKKREIVVERIKELSDKIEGEEQEGG